MRTRLPPSSRQHLGALLARRGIGSRETWKNNSLSPDVRFASPSAVHHPAATLLRVTLWRQFLEFRNHWPYSLLHITFQEGAVAGDVV